MANSAHPRFFPPSSACHNFKTCDECIHHDSKFDCEWCPGISRCSDGIDRFRNAYLLAECNKEVRPLLPACMHALTIRFSCFPPHRKSLG